MDKFDLDAREFLGGWGGNVESERLAALLRRTADEAVKTHCLRQHEDWVANVGYDKRWPHNQQDKPSRFQSGMKIAPAHGRSSEMTLRNPCVKDEGEGYELWWVEGSGGRVRFYPDDFYRVIPPVQKPDWKPGQRLVSGMHIIKLTTYNHSEGAWDCDYWDCIFSKWIKSGAYTLDGYEPWPRVGDWVKPAMCDRAFQVSETLGDRVKTGLDWWTARDLEPAPPPVEQPGGCGFSTKEPHCAPEQPKPRVRPSTEIPLRQPEPDKCFFGEEQSKPTALPEDTSSSPPHNRVMERPKPTLEAPHWDASVHCTNIDCYSRDFDLREAVRVLQKNKP